MSVEVLLLSFLFFITRLRLNAVGHNTMVFSRCFLCIFLCIFSVFYFIWIFFQYPIWSLLYFYALLYYPTRSIFFISIPFSLVGGFSFFLMLGRFFFPSIFKV